MIDRDYFKRQATTLRKMVGVAQDRAVAERLTHLADHFEAKANRRRDPSVERAQSGAGDESGSGRK